MSLLSALRGKSVPYLVTILFGAGGWGIVHVIDSVTKAPTVEYCVNWTGIPPHRMVTVGIRNLSYTTRFKDLVFAMGSSSPAGGEFRFDTNKHKFKCDAPAFKSGTPPDTRTSGKVDFTIPYLQPGAYCEASFAYSGSENQTPPLVLKASEGAVNLMKCSFATCVVRYRIWFIVITAVIIFVLAIILMTLSEEECREKSQDGHAL